MTRSRVPRALRAIARSDVTTTRAPNDRRAVDALAPDLPSALATGQLGLHFQPIVDVRTGGCARVEALLRWTHPAFGPVEPPDVVRLAEATGLLGDCTAWVIRRSAAQRERWAGDGLRLGVSVNVALSALEDDGAARTIRAIGEGGARPTVFTFEISSGELGRLRDVRGALERLGAAGIRIAADNVSASDVPARSVASVFDELKVARTLTRRAVADRRANVELRSLVAMAHDLGLVCVAVGLEDRATFDLVSALGCDLAQGYWASRPLAIDDVPRWQGWVARLALGGAAAAAAHAAIPRVAIAAGVPVAEAARSSTAGASCCALNSPTAALPEDRLDLREVPGSSARLLVEGDLAQRDADRIASAFARDVDAVQAAMGASFDQRPSVYVFTTRASFASGLRAFGQGAISAGTLAAANGGVAFADRDAIVLNWENVSADTALPIVRHELTHLLAHQLVGRATELPAWFDEGLATLTERDDAADPAREVRDASAALVLITSGRVTLTALAPTHEWALRNGALDGRAYTVSAQAVRMVRDRVGADGVRRILLAARTDGFAAAFAAQMGESPADFERGFAARLASSAGAPRIVQAPTPGGIVWTVGGAGAFAPIQISIRGSDYHVEFEATADRDGVYAAVFGSTVPPGEYGLTVTVNGSTVRTVLRV